MCLLLVVRIRLGFLLLLVKECAAMRREMKQLAAELSLLFHSSLDMDVSIGILRDWLISYGSKTETFQN